MNAAIVEAINQVKHHKFSFAFQGQGFFCP